MPSADRVHPEFQRWNVGDKLWITPPDKFGGQGHALLVVLDPGRALGFATRQIGTSPTAPYDGSWSFALEPIDKGTTRFIVRGRADGTRGLFASAFDQFVFGPVHFVMERRMMEGIKARSEGARSSELADVGQVVLWTITFGLVVTSAILVFRRPTWLAALGAFVACAVVFQILTLGQPTLVLGATLVTALALLIGLPPGTPARRHS